MLDFPFQIPSPLNSALHSYGYSHIYDVLDFLYTWRMCSCLVPSAHYVTASFPRLSNMLPD